MKSQSSPTSLYSQFYLGHSYVDIEKGQITTANKSVRLEPKVLSVLIFLAENQGQVLSQEQIFSAVWPNSIYTPNLVQRSINHIRRAVNDDAKTQSVVITHPKRGYSLNAALPITTESAAKKSPANKFSHKTKLFSALVFLLMIALLVNQLWDSSEWLITRIEPMTATAAAELKPQYSPNNQSIGFIRKQPQVNDSLWVKDLVSAEETRLYQSAAAINQFVWLDTNQRGLIVEKQHDGFLFSQIEWQQGQEGNKEPLFHRSDLLDLDQLQWSSENGLYYLGLTGDGVTLFHEDLKLNKRRVLLAASAEFEPTAIALSNDQQRLAITGINLASEGELILLNLSDGSQNFVDRVAAEVIGLGWMPSDRSILLNLGTSLKLQQLDGDSVDILFHNTWPINSFDISANGTAVMSLRKSDSNLFLLDPQSGNPAKRLTPSNAPDYGGSLAPDKQAFAFISERSGSPQIYLTENNQEKLLFSNPANSRLVTRPRWSSNASALAYAVNGEVWLQELATKTSRILANDYFIDEVIQWYPGNTHLLVVALIKGEPWFAKISVTTHSVSPLLRAVNLRAAVVDDKGIVISDKQSLYLFDGGQKTALHSVGQGEITEVFTNKGAIYYQLKQEQTIELWRYHLTDGIPDKLISLPSAAAQHLLDINMANGQILLEKQSTADDLLQVTLSR